MKKQKINRKVKKEFMKNYYKFKVYINAMHSVNFNDKKSNVHSHMWETAVYIDAKESNFINFTKFENILESYFEYYEGKYLNELDKFKEIDPTMEEIGKAIYEDLFKLLKHYNLGLRRIEISENPTRTYIIEE